MTRSLGSTASAAAALLLWAAVAGAAAPPTIASAPAVQDAERPRLLDVPYLTQTEDLCGGAALAMVLRYWGEQRIYPEDFAALVDRSAAGIRTDVLTADVRRRGWQAFPLDPAAAAPGEAVRGHVNRGRPIIALIEVRPDRYHYVVVVAWTGEQVILQDPASGPLRVMTTAEFERAWAAAGHWALLVLPGEAAAPTPAPASAPAPVPVPPVPAPAPSSLPPASVAPGVAPSASAAPCTSLVQEMVARARAGDVADAERGLLAAVGLCPDDADAWRELAGVRFVQKRWRDASVSAARAVEIDPDDAPGWDLLATSRFLNDEPDAALDAWNRIGRPAVDVVQVRGARSRAPTIVELVGLPARTALTPETLHRAARRLDELPSAALTGLRYRPIDGGLATIDAVAIERPIVARGAVPLASLAVRAALQREVRLDLAAPSRSGELWTIAWRWQTARPRVAFALAVPATFLPGVTTVEASWERPSYALPDPNGPDGVSIAQDTRRRTVLNVTDWMSSRLRWSASAGLDRWALENHVTVDGSLDMRLMDDRAAVVASLGGWAPIGTGARFVTSEVSSTWRSSADNDVRSWLAVAGLAATSRTAPLDLWPGAGTGYGRAPLLRAHPLLEHGVVTGELFGRRLAHGTLEFRQPVLSAEGSALQVAVFTDAARAWRRPGGDELDAWQVDAGAGLRFALPGKAGTTRVDVARGLRDRRMVVSAAWQLPWPGW